MSRRAVGLVALASVVITLSFAPAGVTAAPARTTLPDVEDEVMCVLCKVPLNVAEAPEADAERRFISSLIARGYTKEQIKRALVAQYGPAVLTTPDKNGFGLSAYLVPLLALLGGLTAVGLLWIRWRRRTGPCIAPPPPDTPTAPADSRRLDEELARFDA